MSEKEERRTIETHEKWEEEKKDEGAATNLHLVLYLVGQVGCVGLIRWNHRNSCQWKRLLLAAVDPRSLGDHPFFAFALGFNV